MRVLKTLSAALILLLFVSCGSSKSINPLNLLTGNSWALSSIMGHGLDMNQFVGGIPSLSFLDGGKLAGFSGCNNFSGNFLLEGTGIQLDPGAMTKKMCPGSGEQDFISTLSKVGELKVGKDKLILLDGTTELMSFVPKKN
ncbi:META domain-containing protein [Algoriphagus aquimarinus]|uniref:Heat shock protein HslJ n=1 Tax=Algoriphagus aquimarinus TaxID=237018 RepID=A0A1I1BFM5_9BACT|nr:META domain-containing protein [Algoriphagus aquimarinus]SFB47323.1 Heat shock protein HslJ [Algoriphagus aquimarinus]|tara:strand:+ start:43669 stop:44091 length:423 start_codon:yes stop_codon:yes gene_type:complete